MGRGRMERAGPRRGSGPGEGGGQVGEGRELRRDREREGEDGEAGREDKEQRHPGSLTISSSQAYTNRAATGHLSDAPTPTTTTTIGPLSPRRQNFPRPVPTISPSPQTSFLATEPPLCNARDVFVTHLLVHEPTKAARAL